MSTALAAPRTPLAPSAAAYARAANVATIAFALGLAYGLKRFYSHAAFEDLTWLLAPTRRLVEAASGVAFVLEPGRGYLSRGHLFEIVPACAGVNFLIVAFTSLVVGFVHTRATLAARADLVLMSALTAYGVTVVANATRIVLAIRLHAAGPALGPLGPDRLQDAVGAAVYLAFLGATFALGARATGAQRELAL